MNGKASKIIEGQDDEDTEGYRVARRKKHYVEKHSYL